MLTCDNLKNPMDVILKVTLVWPDSSSLCWASELSIITNEVMHKLEEFIEEHAAVSLHTIIR